MDFKSVSEIFDHIDETRGRLVRAVEGLSEEQQGFSPSPDRWSVAQLCEHLLLVERSIAGLLGKLLDKAEAGGRGRAEGAAFAPVSVEHLVEQTRDVKLNAPESARPTGSLPLAESLAGLAGSRAALQALRPRLERADGHALTFPHPAAGPLNLYQWLLFLGAHESRHLAQIEALKEAMNASGAES